MSEVKEEAIEPAAIAILRKRLNAIDRDKLSMEQGIKDTETYLAERKAKLGELASQRIEIENAIEVLSFLKRGVA